MRYRNLFEEGAMPRTSGNYMSNPDDNPRRGRRRNPSMDLGKWFKVDHVVDGATIGAGYVVSEILARDLKVEYNAAVGETLDPMKQAMDFLGHAGVGILGATVLDMAKQRDAGEKFAAGAFAAAITKLIANLHILPPSILNSGSIQIGHGARPQIVIQQPMPSQGNAAVIPGIRNTPYVPPVRAL